MPHLPHGTTESHLKTVMTDLLDGWIQSQEIQDFGLWYYSPTALTFTRHLKPLDRKPAGMRPEADRRGPDSMPCMQTTVRAR